MHNRMHLIEKKNIRNNIEDNVRCIEFDLQKLLGNISMTLADSPQNNICTI